MKRAAEERHIAKNRWREHRINHLEQSQRFYGYEKVDCICDNQVGRFRKGQRVGGCGNPRCYSCHSDKLLKVPRMQTKKANISAKEQQHNYDSEGRV